MKKSLETIGWRGWVALPDLGIPTLKAKIDTGARTSALHAFELDVFEKDDSEWVRFSVHPVQFSTDEVITCEAPVLDRRSVTDSGGHTEERIVIETPLHIGDAVFNAEFTLTARDNMRFRMLMGRTALKGRYLVDSEKSFRFGGSDKSAPAG